jgi:hypothetical protein
MALPAFGQNTARERISARGLSYIVGPGHGGRAFALVMTGLTYHRRRAARDLPRSEPRLPQHLHHDAYRGGAFVGEHGSWSRRRLNGYTVVFVPFDGGRPSGMAKDVVTGFLDGDVAP